MMKWDFEWDEHYYYFYLFLFPVSIYRASLVCVCVCVCVWWWISICAYSRPTLRRRRFFNIIIVFVTIAVVIASCRFWSFLVHADDGDVFLRGPLKRNKTVSFVAKFTATAARTLELLIIIYYIRHSEQPLQRRWRAIP